ncbi:MAG: 3-hydroxybutyryl-CoA dehydrogenase, partial [Fimbriimonadaceae bacterium]|nr:3-hydroxybutyryl-CoA dehydrogenase [Fimbriimonadaceae bacterium]
AEPLKFVEEGGCDIATADALLRANGFKMGPFELIDLVGLDVNLSVSRSLWEAYYAEPRYRPSLLVEERVAAGRLGRKTSRGFYEYPSSPQPLSGTLPKAEAPRDVVAKGELGPAKVLLEMATTAGMHVVYDPGDGYVGLGALHLSQSDGRMAAEHGKDCVLFDLSLDWARTNLVALAASSGTDVAQAAAFFQALGKEVVQVADLPGMLSARTICMLINEACDTLLRKIATRDDVDTAMQKGLNFPGGPLQWADRFGAEYCVRVLDNMARAYGEDRYRASVLLRRMALTGEKFYASAQ